MRLRSSVCVLALSFVAIAGLGATANSARADDRDAILAAHMAMAKIGKFRTTGTVDSPKGPMQRTADIVWPDRFHIVSDQMEIIIIPGQTFMKQGGKWQALPIDMGRMIDSLRPQAMKDSFANTTNVKDLGDSSVNGKSVHGYEYDTSATISGITAKSHAKMWVDKGTGLPVRQEVDGEAMGHKSHSVTDFDFDPSIQVEAPL